MCQSSTLQDDVHSLPAQPAPLVEAVRRPARQAHDDKRVDECALRRRAAERQLELDALADRPSLRTGGCEPGIRSSNAP